MVDSIIKPNRNLGGLHTRKCIWPGRSSDALKEPMYGTRPCRLVQAITRHTCPDPHLGSWNCLPHQAHIAPSEPMSSIDQKGSSLGSFPTPLPFIPTLIGLWGFDLVSSRVWWEAATNKRKCIWPLKISATQTLWENSHGLCRLET